MAGTVERTLALRLIADVGDIGKGLGKVDRTLGKTARSAAKWGKAFTGALVIGGIQRLADATIDGVKAFRAEQDAVRNFDRTVRRMGVPVDRATRALDRMADRAVNLGFDDGQLIMGMDAFVRKTGSIEKATQLNALAMDIARAKNIDLAAAQKQVDQIYNGSARVLKAYGIEGKKGMEAVAAARRVERGKAAAWARKHPMEVLLGKISDGWADVVGNLAQGNFGKAMKAGQKLVTNIVRGIAGWTDKEGKRHAGLWDRLFDATPDKKGNPKGIINRLGADIGNELGKVDWGKSLGEALGAAFDGLKSFIDGEGATQMAAVGGAIAAAMFVGSLFIHAAKAIFSPSAWLNGLKGILAAVGAVMGWALRAGMFVASKFVDAAALTLGTLSRDKVVRGSARGLGGSIGGSVIAGVVAGLTGAVAIGAVAQALTDLFASAETDWTKRGDRPLPDSPFKWPWQEGGFFFPKRNAGGTAGFPGGWSWVGERGPELLKLPTGTQVLNNRRSMAMAAGGGPVVNVTVQVGPTADQAAIGATIMRAIDAALGSGYRFRNPVRGPS